MKTLLNITTLVFTVMFSSVLSEASYARSQEMENACTAIPGIFECKKRVAQSSFLGNRRGPISKP